MKQQKKENNITSRNKISDKVPKPGNMLSEQKVILRAQELLAPMCTAEGLELVHVEYQRETRGRILRLYIDRPGGVTLDDCVDISRQASDLLDVYLDDVGPYRLEVSSPGPDRPLGKKADYEKFKGQRVKILTLQPIDGRKNFKGMLLGIAKGMVELSIDDSTISIPFNEIVKARLNG
jgi:ribosome maturation factor RimP